MPSVGQSKLIRAGERQLGDGATVSIEMLVKDPFDLHAESLKLHGI